jgi:hypothetical protein
VTEDVSRPLVSGRDPFPLNSLSHIPPLNASPNADHETSLVLPLDFWSSK